MIGLPIVSRNPSDSERGTADPPAMTRSSELRSRPARSGSTPIQIVGTPAASVTFSCSIRSASAGGERSGPGITNDDPAKMPAWHSPQALAWNIGTTGRITSASQTPTPSAIIAPNECSTVERWLYTTPFGLPVVPLV